MRSIMKEGKQRTLGHSIANILIYTDDFFILIFSNLQKEQK